MTETEYLQQRLEDQIDWYSAKSSHCQSRYKAIRVVEIVSAAIIPLLSGLGEKIPCGPWIIGTLGVVIAVATAVGSLFKYHENWIQYRATSEALKHEKYLYLASVTPYDGANSYHVLVQRVEGLISNENSTWTQTIKSESKPAAKG
jgi:hypothetical protein